MEYKRIENFKLEKKRIENIVKKYPSNAQALYAQGTVLAYMCHYDDAIDCCTKALTAEPDNIIFYTLLIYCRVQNRDYKAALECLTRLIELKANPD